jgi:glyoxylase I family protein
VDLRKGSIDIGIVCVDAPAMLAFYRDVLGLEHQGDNPVPHGGTMHRLMAGTTMVKLLALDAPPEARSAPGGIPGATGVRYFTFTVGDLDATVAACQAAGRPLVQRAEIGPATIAIVEDPDGNWVEFLQMG